MPVGIFSESPHRAKYQGTVFQAWTRHAEPSPALLYLMFVLFPLAPSTTQGEWGCSIPCKPYIRGHSHTFESGQPAWNAILLLLNTCNHHCRNWMGCAALCNSCDVRQLAPQSSWKHELLLAPQQESTGTWSHQQSLLVPASSHFGRVLPRWQRLALPSEVLSPEGPITGSSLGAVRLDKEEQREQQRRQRQVKASKVTQENMCLLLSQFEEQVSKFCRLRSLILSVFMRGKV